MNMQRIATLSFAALLAIGAAGTAPSFAQGASQSPSSPNSANNMPQSPNSEPVGARTLAPGTTGTGRTGTVGRHRTQPAPAQQYSGPAAQPALR